MMWWLSVWFFISSSCSLVSGVFFMGVFWIFLVELVVYIGRCRMKWLLWLRMLCMVRLFFIVCVSLCVMESLRLLLLCWCLVLFWWKGWNSLVICVGVILILLLIIFSSSFCGCVVGSSCRCSLMLLILLNFIVLVSRLLVIWCSVLMFIRMIGEGLVGVLRCSCRFFCCVCGWMVFSVCW